jgi:hypothetical protein
MLMLACQASRVFEAEASIGVILDLQTPGARDGGFVVDDPPYPLGGISISDIVQSFANQTEEFVATGSAFIDVDPKRLMGVKVTVYGESSNPNSLFSPNASAVAQAFHRGVADYNGPESSLVYTFSLSANVTPSTPFFGAQVSLTSFNAFGPGGSAEFKSILGPGTITHSLPVINGKIAFDLRLTALAGVTLGYAEADASHTVRLISITHPDGSTPESHGFSLIFASGMVSPNIASVPEAASFMTWIVLCAAAAAQYPRRVVT